MDFLSASHLLEGIKDDLEYGFIADAVNRLREAIRNPTNFQFEDDPSHIHGRSIAQKPASGKVWKKVRPGIADKSGGSNVIKFKSLLRAWKEHTESGGEDSPEALGGFLHRHFAQRKLDHGKVMKLAMKAHGKDKATARRVADHYMTMMKGQKTEAYKTKRLFFRRAARNRS